VRDLQLRSAISGSIADAVTVHGERPFCGCTTYQLKSGSIDFVEEIPTRPQTFCTQASTVLAA